MSSSTTKTVAFLGASGGVGLSALKHALAAGHTCLALCRTPAKLEAIFPTHETPVLTIIPGNAHDEAAVARCLVVPGRPAQLVDTVISSIGSVFHIGKMATEDPDVCKKGIATLLAALATLRKAGVQGRPRIVAVSTAGISRFARDVPLATLPMNYVLKVPHDDKRVLEERLVASGEEFTLVRPQLLTDGASDKAIRVGIEDPVKGVESKAVGYVISREDAGRWITENLVMTQETKYLGKMVTITY